MGRAGQGYFADVVRERTLSDQVAASITDVIVSGRLAPGERLQSERELAEEFGVSRTVIREAIRSLVAHGLVESRSGRGVQVAVLGPDAVTRSMNLFVRGNAAIDYVKVHEVRSALEVQMAGVAAHRATAEDLRKLAQLVQAMQDIRNDPERVAQLDVEFHRAIASATQNELFLVVLSSIDDVLLEIRRNAFDAPGMIEYAIQAHGAILAALEQHDEAAARQAMSDHLEVAEKVWSGPGVPNG